eukprot:2099835-Pyramimonas_sp.AAC.1
MHRSEHGAGKSNSEALSGLEGSRALGPRNALFSATSRDGGRPPWPDRRQRTQKLLRVNTRARSRRLWGPRR